MKILLISEFFPENRELVFSGGVEARTLFLAKNLAKKHQVTVITTRLKNSKEKEKIFNFDIVRVGIEQKYQATTGNILGRIDFIIKAILAGWKLDCDLVEGSNFITHYIAKMISIRKKVPVVAWYPDVWVGEWIKNTGVVRFL